MVDVQVPVRHRGAVEELLRTLADLDALPAEASERLLGPPPRPRDVAAAAARSEARVWAVRRELYEASVSRQEAADRMGVSTNQVTNLISSGDLLQLAGEDGVRLPSWQFDPEAPRGRLEGIRQVAVSFPGQILSFSHWMTHPQPTLRGRIPREMLRDGDVDTVVSVARAIGG